VSRLVVLCYARPTHAGALGRPHSHCVRGSSEGAVFWGATLRQKANRKPRTVLSTNPVNQLMAVRSIPLPISHSFLMVNICEEGEVLLTGISVCAANA